jgi:serine/threonine protein kinase
VGLPAGALLFLLLAFIIILLLLVLFKRRERDDWEIEYDELEVGDVLGTGGFGEVHRALWKGTEVAVKVMASEKTSKDMERSFKDEVRAPLNLYTRVTIRQSTILSSLTINYCTRCE